jgi:IclR family transcriptional regulator, pca regulon regulatory protein
MTTSSVRTPEPISTSTITRNDGRYREIGNSRPWSRYRNESLARALEVLSIFDDDTLVLDEDLVSSRLSLALPQARQLIAMLEAAGLLSKVSGSGFCLSLSVLTLGTAALRGPNLVHAAESALRKLAVQTGETVSMGILVHDDLVYLARIRNLDLVSANIQVGDSILATRTAMGRLLLSYALPDSHPAQDYLVHSDTNDEGLVSVSVPVVGPGSIVVAAITVTAASSRHTADSAVDSLLPLARTAAADTARRLS